MTFSLKKMAPGDGIEPPTWRLTAACIYQLSYPGMGLEGVVGLEPTFIG